MMDRLKYKLGMAVIAVLGLTACSSSSTGGSSRIDDPSTAFSIELQDASFFGGGSLDGISVNTTTESGKLIAEVSLNNAADLKGVFFDLHYDARAWHPVVAKPTELLAATDSLLHLAVLDDPGVIHFGEAMLNPDTQLGFSGSGMAARVEFAAGVAPKLAPNKPSSQTRQIEFGWWAADTFYWNYDNPGDYDLNGEVNLADIVQIAIHYGQHLPAPASRDIILVDGDVNGEINLADLAVISINYKNSRVDGYDLYSSESRNDIPNQWGVQGESAVIESHIPFSQMITLDQELLNQYYPTDFLYPFPAVSKEKYYWLRPSSNTGQTQQPSTVASYQNFVNGFNWDYEYYTIPELTFDFPTRLLTIYYQNTGDIDQDSVVLRGDGFLQEYLMEEHFQSTGPFALGSFGWVLDCNKNDEVNLSDITPVAVQKTSSIAGYKIYTIADKTNPEDSKSLVFDLPFSTAIGNPETEQLRFEIDISDLEGQYCQVQGYTYKDEVAGRSKIFFVGE